MKPQFRTLQAIDEEIVDKQFAARTDFYGGAMVRFLVRRRDGACQSDTCASEGDGTDHHSHRRADVMHERTPGYRTK